MRLGLFRRPCTLLDFVKRNQMPLKMVDIEWSIEVRRMAQVQLARDGKKWLHGVEAQQQ